MINMIIHKTLFMFVMFYSWVFQQISKHGGCQLPVTGLRWSPMWAGATGWAHDQSQAPPVTTWSQHILVTGHQWPHNLSVLFCGEATTSTTSAGSYLIVSSYSYGVIKVVLVLKSFGYPVMHSWWWILAVWECWLNVIDWDIKMIL